MLRDYERRFNRTATIGLLSGFALLLTVVVTAFLTYSRNQQSSERVEHTHQVLDQIAQVGLNIERAETASRGYLLAPDGARLKTFRDNIAAVDPALDRLGQLIADNPEQVRNLARFREAVEEEVIAVNEIIAFASTGQFDRAILEYRLEAPLRRVTAIRTIAGQMIAEESRLLEERRENERWFGQLLKIVLGGAAFLMLVVGVFTFILARRYMHDLGKARDQLHLLNTDLEGEVERRTADLQRANEEIQRFAYIVSHDLRSPLVNILGFTAELEGANKSITGLIDRAKEKAPDIVTEDVLHTQEDLPEAIGFIRAATQKMDRLINAILKLSREGRRNLTPEKLPMDSMVDEIVSTMSHKIDASSAKVTVEKPLPDFVGDRVAIEQIFSNLIENSIKYSDPSRPAEIAVRGKADKGRVTFEVQDNGRGIDKKDHARIFDLFRRSGRQDQPGEGIGLAQVRALIHRLGGWIEVDSALGEGSTFRLNLPITYVDYGSGE